MIRQNKAPRTLTEIRAELQARRQAMQWLFRLRDKSIAEEDLADWAYWYESEVRNKSAFDQMQEFWIGVGALGSGPEGQSRIRRLLEPERRGGQGFAVRASNAPRRRIGLAAAGAVLVLTGGFALSWRFWPPRPAEPEINRSVPLFRTTSLPDGSKVELAPKSFMTVRYTATERSVTLTGGEAYFKVVHDPKWPFVVSVNDIEVRDVGTTFNIRAAGRRTVVMVATGAVTVYSKDGMPGSGRARATGSSVRVTAGHEVKWDAGSRPVVTRASPQRALAWRHGRLDYIDEPLSAVIADVDRYLAHPVLIKGGSLGNLAFTGTVFTDSASQWVRALPSEFPVKVISEGRNTLLVPVGTSRQVGVVSPR